MEKLLIFSDSHGSLSVMSEAIGKNRLSVSTVIHLGDGADDIERIMQDYPEIPCITIRGNREELLYASDSLPREMTFDVGGCRIFMCHGHIYNVKCSMDRAIYCAVEERADVLLYGHTHAADYSIANGYDISHPLHIVNPGSAALGYAELTIADAKPKIKLIREQQSY